MLFSGQHRKIILCPLSQLRVPQSELKPNFGFGGKETNRVVKDKLEEG